MNPLSWFRGLVARKSVESDYPGTWIPVTGAGVGINNANLLEANREWVYIAVDKNATSVAGVRIKVMKYASSGDDKEVFEGALIDFLENPADGLTAKDFIYLNIAYKELTGNALWEIVGRKRLKPLIPTRILPIVAAGQITGFKYTDLMGQQRTIAAKDVLHDRTPDLSKPYWGMGKLQKIARWADTSSYVTEFLSRFFVNGATFGGFITTEEESQERIKLIKLGLANDHVGVANAHKIGVLPKGSDFKSNTASMSDMEMGATDDRYRDKILAAFGLPKTLVGLTTEVNRASANASEYIYAKYTMKPLVDDLVEFLNTKVAPLLDNSGKYYYAYDEFIPDDQGLALQERKAALANAPYMTVNEVRASVGLAPVDGGDVIKNPAPPTPGGPANDNPNPDDEPQKALPARARMAFKRERMVSDIVDRAFEIASSHHDPDAEAHKSFVSRVEAHLNLIENKVRDFNGRQENDVALRLKQITKAIDKTELFDIASEVSILVDFVGPILQGLMLEQAVAEYEAQQFPGQLDPQQPRLRAIAELAAKRLAKSYNQTTQDLLASALNDGIKKGEDLTQLTDRVKQVYAYSNEVRAKMVANTEAFYIANKGSKEAYKQSGVVTTMRWYTAEDERVCEFCDPEEGRIVDVDDDFYAKGTTITGRDGGTLDLDYRTIDVPPLHTNCRCFIRPETIEVE